MAYHRNDKVYKHKARERKYRKVALLFVGFIILGVVAVGVDLFVDSVSDSNSVISSTISSSVQSANVSVYRTEHFQFQAPEDWVLVSTESTDNKFVYVKNDGSLIVQRLIVYINSPATDQEADFRATKVLPVDVNSLGKFIAASQVSSGCSESWPEGLMRNPSRIIHESVSFVCHPDSSQYNVIIGEIEGDESITVTLDDGREVSLTILFSNLTAYPEPGDLYNIISSFSTL